VEGLRAALSAALSYAFTVVERGEEHAPAIPTPLLAQARMAARNHVGLDTVLRRYLVGYSLLVEFVIEEGTDSQRISGASLQRILSGQASLFDELVAAVTEEHKRETSVRPTSTEQRRAERVKRLLAGQLLDTAGLEYDFDAHHLGAVAVGPFAAEVIRALAKTLGSRLLLIPIGDDHVWGWLGANQRVDAHELKRQTSLSYPPRGTAMAIGESGEGLAGWRLSHRQARAALPIALRSHECLIHYGDVPLLASILRDDLLASSLRQIYLAPLAQERDGGAKARETLRAYFLAEGNISSAALTLGVSRQTVNSRLRGVERRLGRLVHSCATELDAALRLHELDDGVAC
jgi:hypothetical protein